MKGWQRIAAGVGVGVVFGGIFLARMDGPGLWQALQQVHPAGVLLACGVLLGEFVLRTLRWQILLRPLLPARPAFAPLFRATVVGMGLNVVLPLRLGEVARPLLAARATGLEVVTLLTLAVLERVFDLLGMASVLALMLALLPPAAADDALIGGLQRWGARLAGVGVLAFAGLLGVAWRERGGDGWLGRLVARLPGPAGRIGQRLYRGVVVGAQTVRAPGPLLAAAAVSVLTWINGALAIYALFHAFSFALPFAAACFVTVGIALSVALPQAPGFAGVFHVAIEQALRLWGLPDGAAQAYALVFWGVSFVPVTALALIFGLREGLDWRALRTD